MFLKENAETVDQTSAKAFARARASRERGYRSDIDLDVLTYIASQRATQSSQRDSMCVNTDPSISQPHYCHIHSYYNVYTSDPAAALLISPCKLRHYTLITPPHLSVTRKIDSAATPSSQSCVCVLFFGPANNR